MWLKKVTSSEQSIKTQKSLQTAGFTGQLPVWMWWKDAGSSYESNNKKHVLFKKNIINPNRKYQIHRGVQWYTVRPQRSTICYSWCKLEDAPPPPTEEKLIHSSCGQWKFWHLKPLTNQSVCVLSPFLWLHSDRGDNLSALSVWCTVITCDLFNREPAVSLIWPSVRGRIPPLLPPRHPPQSGRCLKSNCRATMLRCARPLRP